ncbi:MAG: DUF6273 domain-containing protein [Clostridia bacterium]
MGKSKKFKLSIIATVILILSLSLLLVACSKPTNANNIYSNSYSLASDTPYARINLDGTANANGDYVLYGYYPQSLKANDVSITATQPDANGYFEGSDGNKYVQLTATPYKETYTFINGEKIQAKTKKQKAGVYFFKVEPILWRVLSAADGKLTLLCESIIDNEAYISLANCENPETKRTIFNLKEGVAEGTFSNNWEHSDIRTWLNGKFLTTALSPAQQAMLEDVTLDNKTTAITADEAYSTCQNNTVDKIYLPSYKDIMSSNGGLSETQRTHITSDFARCKGAWMVLTDKKAVGNGWWMLRSPSGSTESSTYENANRVSSVFANGKLKEYDSYYASVVTDTLAGVVPMLTISIA